MWITCDVLISCFDSHFDGTHSLQRIHWWVTDVMQKFSKSVSIKTHSSSSWMAWGWVYIHTVFIFKWTISWKTFWGRYFQISESGSGHCHAVTVSDGSGRPEEPAGRAWRWACGRGAPGASHWCLSREQQRLCHQSYTRSGAESLHTDGRLGHRGF